MGQRLTKSTVTGAVAAAPTGYALAQQPGGAGNLNLNGALVVGGVGKADVARRVDISSVGDDRARTFTVTGTDRYGRALVEAIKGANAGQKVTTINDFLTVANIAIDGAAAGNVTAGTSATISGPWITVDRMGTAKLGIQVDAPATTTYTVEQTNDDPFSAGVGVLPPGGLGATPVLAPVNVPNMNAKTGSNATVIDSAVTAVRLTVTAFTVGDVAAMKLAPGFAEQYE